MIGPGVPGESHAKADPPWIRLSVLARFTGVPLPREETHMASPLNRSIRSCIDSFVEKLTTLVKHAALEAVSDALGSAAPARRAPGRRRTKKKAARRTTRKKAAKRVRRSSGDVDATAAAVLAHVRANPGQSITEIAAALGLSSKDLRLPVLKLLEQRKIKTTGQRRGTRYHAGGRRGPAKRKATRKRAAKRKATKRKRAGKKKPARRKAARKRSAKKRVTKKVRRKTAKRRGKKKTPRKAAKRKATKRKATTKMITPKRATKKKAAKRKATEPEGAKKDAVPQANEPEVAGKAE